MKRFHSNSRPAAPHWVGGARTFQGAYTIKAGDREIAYTWGECDAKLVAAALEAFLVFRKHHLILPQHLNHDGKLFGGQILAWADEAAYLCASLAYPRAHFVTKVFEETNFVASAAPGDIIEFSAEITEVRTTSLRVALAAHIARTGQPIFSTAVVFVHVEDGAKAPIPRGNVS